jgi:hypothetical protein
MLPRPVVAEIRGAQMFLRDLRADWHDPYLVKAVIAWFRQESGYVSKVIGNNPFNIRPGSASGEAIGVREGGYLVFPTLTTGFSAAATVLTSTRMYGYPRIVRYAREGNALFFLSTLSWSSWSSARYGARTGAEARSAAHNKLIAIYVRLPMPVRRGLRVVPVPPETSTLPEPPATSTTYKYLPKFVSAEAVKLGAWTGYSGRIQVRPGAAGGSWVAAWLGGYNTHGIFIQSGILQPGSTLTKPGEALLFAWASHNPFGAVDDPAQPLPLIWTPVAVRAGDWYTFRLTQSPTNGRWYFRYQDPGGAWHTQGSFAGTPIDIFGAHTEYWTSGAHEVFPTQVIQKVMVREGSRWVYTPMDYGPDPGQCGHERLDSPIRGTLVFRALDGPCAGEGRSRKELWT